MSYIAGVSLLLPVCSAVSYAHQVGYKFRELKLQDIVVYRSSTDDSVAAKIAKQVEVTGSLHTGLGVSGKGVGPGKASRREAMTDIFCLGEILYEVLSGRHPIEGLDADDKRMHEKHGGILRLRQARPGCQFPHVLDQILGRMLTRNPIQAYDNCEQLVDDLHFFLENKCDRISARWFKPNILGNPKSKH